MDGNKNGSVIRPVVNDALEQDTDKQISFDLIRLDYDSSYKILYLDSDELLVPSNILQEPYIIFRNQPRINFTMATLREHLFQNWGTPHDHAEYHMYRMAVAAWTPSKVVHLRDSNEDGNVQANTIDCMLKGKFVVCSL